MGAGFCVFLLDVVLFFSLGHHRCYFCPLANSPQRPGCRNFIGNPVCLLWKCPKMGIYEIEALNLLVTRQHHQVQQHYKIGTPQVI